MIRVALYVDEPVAEAGFLTILSTDDGISVAHHSSRPAQLLAHLASDATEIVLLDMTPHLSLGLIQEIRKKAPDCKVILWVREISTEWAFQAIELGVRGILLKTLPTGLQVKCLRKVSEGELWLAKNLTEHLLAGKSVSLTRREGQLVSALTQGLKNKEIAEVLGITEGTVKVYLSRLFHKVGVKDRFELALYGLKNLGASESAPEVPPAMNSETGAPSAGSLQTGTLRRLIVATLGQTLIGLLRCGIASHASTLRGALFY